MQLKVTRTIPLEEVIQRVTEIERRYTENMEDIPEKFNRGLVGRDVFEDYVEWMGMVHALRAWREGEDFDYLTEDVMELEWEEFSKLTPRRLDLLDQLSRVRSESINDLAAKIGRDVKNVYMDLKKLESLGLIRLVKEGRSMVPELLVHEITFLLW
ncbi:helix-turn-helix domain-containing protein [Candidatus Bathyarchaeota archaeon]|nr:helix-turn-helix domain-containing protein [Candidatus Bathyarchaeota archaeon]